MATTLAQIQKQIEDLQRKADDMRSKEVAGVVARIREAIAHYGISSEELFGDPAGRTAVRPRARPGESKGKARSRRGVPASPAQPRFRDADGNTWSGRGRRPEWLVAALARGGTLEDFLVVPGA